MSSLRATVCCQWLSTVKLIIPLHIQQLVSRPLFPLYHTVDTIWSTQAATVPRNCEAVKEIMHLNRWKWKLWQKRGTSLLVLTNCAVIKVWICKCTHPHKMGDVTRAGETSIDENPKKQLRRDQRQAGRNTAQNPPEQRQWPNSDKARQVRNYQGQHWQQDTGVEIKGWQKKKGGETETGCRAQKIQGDETIKNKTGDTKSSWQYESFSQYSVQWFAHWNWLCYFTTCYLVQ